MHGAEPGLPRSLARAPPARRPSALRPHTRIIIDWSAQRSGGMPAIHDCLLLASLLVLSGATAEPASSESACSALLHGFDFLNTDHQSSKTAHSPAECCTLCEANPVCKAFTYQTEQHKCYMKNSNAGKTQNPACISGCKAGKCPPSPPGPPHPPGPSPPCLLYTSDAADE